MRFWICLFILLASINLFANPDTEKLNLAPNPSFEKDLTGIKTNTCVYGGWFPIGVVPDSGSGSIEIVEDAPRSGKKSLKIVPHLSNVEGTIYFSKYNGGEEVREKVSGKGVSGARTLAFRLDQDILTCNASIWVKKEKQQNINLKLVWYTRRHREPFIKISEDCISEPEMSEQGWYKYSIQGYRIHSSRQVQLVIETDGEKPVYIDDVEIYFNRYPHVDILVNQVGYESHSRAKGIILQSSTSLNNLVKSFRVINLENFKTVYNGTWTEKGYLKEWDWYHWIADMSTLETPGRYVVETQIGEKLYHSQPFEIADHLLLPKTAEIGYRFYYYQRCGMEIPYFHAACHTDDAKMLDGSFSDLAGGWHDAGDYNKYNGYTPESVYALVLAYDRHKNFFDQFDRDNNGRADILDEALWGAQFLEKCINPETGGIIDRVFSGYGYWGRPEDETDNIPDSGDERPSNESRGDASFCVPGFALLGIYLPNGEHYIDIAEQLYEKIGGGIDKILPLYRATGKEKYRQIARKRAETLVAESENNTNAFRELAEFALAFPKDSLVPQINSLASRRLAELQQICDNTFGITRRRDKNGQLIYFRHYGDVNNWYVGESRELLDTAYEGMLLEKLGFPDGRIIAENQIHWILGRNPFGVSMMEGVGSVFIPHYHHRYNTIPGNPRGAVPGAVVNGITRTWPDHDRPWLDLHPEPNGDYQSNEPWLPHNNRWLFLLSLWAE